MVNMIKEHPRGLMVLFFSEMWERFSYYGMRALLVLFLTKHFLFGDEKSYLIYGTYTSLVYATPIFGGMIADKILGFRRAVILGGILMATGQFLLATSSIMTNTSFLYTGLAFMIVGNGLFKPNISTIVGSLYEQGDPRRDGGFTIFYMGINVGAFLSPLICGWVGEAYGWHYGFAIAGLGMLIGLVTFHTKRDLLDGKGLPPSEEALNGKVIGIPKEKLVWIGALLTIPVITMLINFNDWKPLGVLETTIPTLAGLNIMSLILAAIGLTVIIIVTYNSFKSTLQEWQKLFVAVFLTFFSIVFWALFEQAGSSLSLFTDRNVDRMFFGVEIPASVYQSVNAFFIIVLAIPFSAMWIKLSKVGKEPSTPLKFAMGIIQVGLGFGILVLGAKLFGGDGMVPMVFLILAYFIHTTAELCLSPVGLSMITKLSPARIVGFMMGVWFLAPSIAQYIGGIIATLTSLPATEGGGSVNVLESLTTYSDVFYTLTITSVIIGLILLLFIPILRKMMHGVH